MFLDAVRGCNKGRPPLWIMRQAGRYLPEYQAIRKKHSFLEMCHTPEIAAKVTLTPFIRFPFDAAILFSDILILPESYNLGLQFVEGVGPQFQQRVTPQSTLPEVDPQTAFPFIPQAIAILKEELKVPLLGFAGAPLTVASYMIEGGAVREGTKTKQWIYKDPKSFTQLLEKVTQDTIAYLQLQIDAGVDAVQLFESSLYLLPKDIFRTFCLPVYKKILASLRKSGTPIIYFGRGTSLYWKELSKLPFSVLSCDWQTDLAEVRRSHHKLPLQGNIDPMRLFASPASVKKHVGALLETMGKDPAYICNLGHGILPQTPLESVEALVEAVHTCR